MRSEASSVKMSVFWPSFRFPSNCPVLGVSGFCALLQSSGPKQFDVNYTFSSSVLEKPSGAGRNKVHKRKWWCVLFIRKQFSSKFFHSPPKCLMHHTLTFVLLAFHTQRSTVPFHQVSLFCGETFCIILRNRHVPGKLFQFSEMIIFNHSPSKTIYQAVEDNEP